MNNYVVWVQDANGARIINCDTIKEVWAAIGSRTMGGLYRVSSPTGQDCSDFIPY